MSLPQGSSSLKSSSPEQLPSGQGAAPQAAQRPAAASAHRASQFTSQQKASAAQTTVQQARSSQNGVPFAMQQSPEAGSPQPPPPPPQRALASSTHPASHSTSQQKGLKSQTRQQQVASLQPGSALTSKQSPPVPQVSNSHWAWLEAVNASGATSQSAVARSHRPPVNPKRDAIDQSPYASPPEWSLPRSDQTDQQVSPRMPAGHPP